MVTRTRVPTESLDVLSTSEAKSDDALRGGGALRAPRVRRSRVPPPSAAAAAAAAGGGAGSGFGFGGSFGFDGGGGGGGFSSVDERRGREPSTYDTSRTSSLCPVTDEQDDPSIICFALRSTFHPL